MYVRSCSQTHCFWQGIVTLTLAVILLGNSHRSLIAQESSTRPELNQENLAEWRQHILPVESDLAWQQISWLTTFAEGIQAANEQDRPLLLWVMNGHPLACT